MTIVKLKKNKRNVKFDHFLITSHFAHDFQELFRDYKNVHESESHQRILHEIIFLAFVLISGCVQFSHQLSLKLQTIVQQINIMLLSRHLQFDTYLSQVISLPSLQIEGPIKPIRLVSMYSSLSELSFRFDLVFRKSVGIFSGHLCSFVCINDYFVLLVSSENLILVKKNLGYGMSK